MLRRQLLGLCLLPWFATPLMAAPPDPLEQAVTRHLGADFSGVVLTRGAAGATPVTRTYGLANADKNLATVAATPYQIGSITKWLTAVAVLRLVDQGKLALEAPVSTWLPQMPPHIGAITLRQLLSNSAGIPNGVMQAVKQDKSLGDLPLTHVDAALRFSTGPLLFAPGSGWEYSPTTWIVVAAVIEKVTGHTFGQALARLVLEPAGATASGVPVAPFKDLPGAAIGYKAAGSREVNMAPHIVFVAASGTVYSTAGDLLKLAQAVYETPLLSGAARAELSRIMVPEQNYALGGRVMNMVLGGRERRVAWETGAIAGYKSLLAHVPGESKTVVILNNTNMDQSALAAAGRALLESMY
jgi:D-alanyl-D-alanine carboxypeptidase